MQIRERLFGMPEPIFERCLLRGHRLVFFRSGKLRLRERPFIVRDPLFKFRLCVIQRGHFLGRSTPRFHETLHRLLVPLLQLVFRRGKCRVFLVRNALRLGQQIFRFRQPTLDSRLFRGDGTVRLLRSETRFFERPHDSLQISMQLLVPRRQRRVLLASQPFRLGQVILRLGQSPLDVRLLRGDRIVPLLRSAARFIERPREFLQIRIQLRVLRGKFRVLSGGDSLRLGRGIGEFRQPLFQFRLRRLGRVPLLFERVIRLRETCLQFHLRLEKPGMFLPREPRGLPARGVRVRELPLQLVPHLHERKIFLIRRTLRLLQRAQRRRETPVDFIPLRRQRCMPRLRLFARLIKGALHLGQLPLYFRARLRLRRVPGLRGLLRLRQRPLRIREALPHFLRGGAQRFFLLARPARRVRHRLLKFPDLPLDVRFFPLQRGAFLIRGMCRVGKCLLARCDLRVRGREFLADLFEFRCKTLLRLLMLRLQPRQLFPVPGALGGQLRFDLRVETLRVREPALHLLLLRDERLARAVQRSAQVLVVRARLRKLRGDDFLFLARRIAFRREGREILLAGFFEFRQSDGHPLHLRLRLVAFA